ncbi:MAG TPA: hypothetical protein VMF58_03680 [Rhizomicrobium sp.]|nr:hypothetical protein [Rhizomicrobium sp.]
MTLSDIANIGTFIGALGAFISLIYLGIQVRQAELNQRSIASQGVAARITGIVQWSAEPHIANLRTRVFLGDTNYTAEELTQLSFILRVSILSLQDTHLQFRSKLTDETTMDSTIGGTRPLLASPVFQALWQHGRTHFAKDTQVLVDKIIRETPLAEPVDIVARFKSDLAAIVA